MTFGPVLARDDITIQAARSTGLITPEFSICVPQFNRTSFVIEACRSLATQSFHSFEICISDDRSTDGREGELISYLQSSGMNFTCARQIRNRRYDGNLRTAISLARGRYVFLLGNDDRFASCDTLKNIHAQLIASAPAHVALVNYRELGTGRTFARVGRSGKLGSGPDAAIRTFRDFSFVSGVIFDAEAAKRWSTDKWDGSEMYQMYLGCRILAAGGTLVGISEVCIEKDIQIPGESVDSYAAVKIVKSDLSPVVLPMSQIAPLVTDAVAPYVSPASLERTAVRITAQLLLFTYAFWLIELRRTHSWKYALSVYRGLNPRKIHKQGQFSFSKGAFLSLLYLSIGISGLVIPVRLFRRLQPVLYRLAKHRRT
jgi:glycosyltransferase involved in cell wall biosynthesis